MRNWYKEEYTFKIIVVSVGANGKPENCRNSHEIGDTYTCKYGCPSEFCSKSVAKLFPLMEAIRAGGDLAGATKHSGEFFCSDGVVTFKLEGLRNE